MSDSLFSLLNVAASGLAGQSASLLATGQNVANVNTPGYARVTAQLETTSAPNGFSGGGVVVGGMDRAFSALTFGSLLTEQGLGGSADARSQALAQTEATLAPSSGTIGDSINSLYTSFQALEAAPTDPSARAGVLAAAGQLSTSIVEAAKGLATQRSSMVTQAQGVASSLNANLAQIAKLNGEIAQARGSGAQPTDLEDQRDQLVSTVSGQTGAQVLTDANGDFTLLSGGTALVSNGVAATVSVSVDAANNLKITSALGGGTPQDITQSVTSGTLGGIREARDTDIAQASSQLDTLAYNLATSVNAVQSAGYGLDGVTGRNLFTQPAVVAGAAGAMSVDPAVLGNPSAIAASTTAAGLPGGNDGAVALAQLASQPLGTSATPAAAFASLSGGLGSAAAAANSDQSLRQATIHQASALNSSVSGVSLDQEMTNLDQFQRAYEASSQVLQTANALLGELMQAV